MYQPVIPQSGLSGWRFLQRTYDTQYSAFVNSSQLQRDTDYFREKIGTIKSADDLVSDRRLLSVALGAFGLQDDIDNKYLIKRMLQEGTTRDDALANKFVDPRYQRLSAAFGFGPGELPKNQFSTFADDIIAKFERQSFEVAVGNEDQTMRIALTAEREFASMAAAGASENANWFSVMGHAPMRKLFETALNLPTSFSQIDIDRQRSILAEKSQAVFGVTNPSQFADPELQEELLTRYTALSQLQESNIGTSSASIALSLLGS